MTSLVTHLNPCKLRKRKGNTEFYGQKCQEQQRRRKQTGSKLEGALAEAGEEPVPWQQAAALLADQVVFNIYRKAVQEIEHPQLLVLLQMQRRGRSSSRRCRR